MLLARSKREESGLACPFWLLPHSGVFGRLGPHSGVLGRLGTRLHVSLSLCAGAETEEWQQGSPSMLFPSKILRSRNDVNHTLLGSVELEELARDAASLSVRSSCLCVIVNASYAPVGPARPT